jgi:secondary thiamine-phosphate synthase enzyme
VITPDHPAPPDHVLEIHRPSVTNLWGMDSTVISVRTGGRASVTDLTDRAAEFTKGRGDGLLHVFVPHATAGIAIIETGAGSDDDLLTALDDVLPAQEGKWQHRHGSRGHGRDHVLPAFIAPYASLPVLNGRIALGTWQSICLVDTNGDNPDRQVRFSFLASA